MFCENTCTKHRKYQRIQRLHFPWQQATNSKNTAIYSVSPQWFFQKNMLFGPFLASETSQDKEGGGTPPPPFHILNFKIFTKSKTLQFLELKTRPEPHFLTVFTMFSARAQIFTQKKATSKNHLKINFLLGGSVFGLPPLAPNRPLPRAIFDGICDVLCTSSTPQKRAGLLPRGWGSAPPARLPIAKAKATPHAMRSNMPGIRCLVHRRI